MMEFYSVKIFFFVFVSLLMKEREEECKNVGQGSEEDLGAIRGKKYMIKMYRLNFSIKEKKKNI